MGYIYLTPIRLNLFSKIAYLKDIYYTYQIICKINYKHIIISFLENDMGCRIIKGG